MKKISNLERNRRKYRKMLNSLSNKMHGNNLVWYNSLSQKAQYSLLFRMNREKLISNFKFEKFINKNKSNYVPRLDRLRDSKIEHIIN